MNQYFATTPEDVEEKMQAFEYYSCELVLILLSKKKKEIKSESYVLKIPHC